jgi:hypothetical protein
VVAFLDPEQLLARNALGRAVSSIEEMRAAVAAFSTDPREWEPASLRSREYMDSRFNEARIVGPYVEALSDLYAPAASAGAT